MRTEGKQRYAKIKSLIEIVIKTSIFFHLNLEVLLKVRKEFQFYFKSFNSRKHN